MMSDSDDTDVLLVIPPDYFIVPSSSDTDVSSDHIKSAHSKGGVISELVKHMQSLESRLYAIESKGSSLDVTLLTDSIDSQIANGTVRRPVQTLPRTKSSVSQNSTSQCTPVKLRQSLSVPSTPSGYCASLNCANLPQNDSAVLGTYTSVGAETNKTKTNASRKLDMHDPLTSNFASTVVSFPSHKPGLPHATVTLFAREPSLIQPTLDECRDFNTEFTNPEEQSCSDMSTSILSSAPGQRYPESKIVQNMELSEVDELLQEMKVTEIELSKRINNASSCPYFRDYNSTQTSIQANNPFQGNEPTVPARRSINWRLDSQLANSKLHCRNSFPSIFDKKQTEPLSDLSLPYSDSFPVDEIEKMISEFKIWGQNTELPNVKTGEGRSLKSVDNVSQKTTDTRTLSDRVGPSTPESSVTNSRPQAAGSDGVETYPACKSTEDVSLPRETEQYLLQLSEPNKKNVAQSNTIQSLNGESMVRTVAKHNIDAATNTDFQPKVPQRLFSLSDFWDSNTNKTKDEMLLIRLEEERFRRDHCEHLIQELQRRLLEQQEKVAVALRVDNEKNELITQLHGVCTKLKQRVHSLEVECASLQANLESFKEKHETEISAFQAQIKRSEGELSKALDLAAGYKEKSDELMKEKMDRLKTHANELESYKLLVQQAEARYEEMKGNYDKLLEKNRQAEETLKNLQQELAKERAKGGEVRNEMSVIHKALDTCETELTILKQEKEGLQLKLKEEVNRNTILEQKNALLLSSIDDAKKAEKLAKDEKKSLADQKEQIRAELQEVYQKQVDEVVKAKLQEFQTQLDAAESEFVEELKTRQQVIAECAARKIKDIMDKHRLEINLLEEKHKEEKRLCELQLAQAVQKSAFLETQLDSQRTAKSQLAEQLHSVMQAQWQQALHIISGGTMENMMPIQRIHAEKLLQSKVPRNGELSSNAYTKISQEPIRLPTQIAESKPFYGMLSREEENLCRNTLASIDETPLTSRKESKDDLRKYIRMITEMRQQKEEISKVMETAPSPPPISREVPKKHYTKKEFSIMSEDSVTWEPVSEDVTEFMPVSQKITSKVDQPKNKPPWK